jgi:hypothetical protein
MDFDTAVKLNIYKTIAETTKMPTSAGIARALAASIADVETAFARLHQKRLLVPEPGDPSRIRMAPPFSGIETPFVVRIRENSYYPNCVWDALGIPAMLHQDAVVEASDGHTGEPLTMEVRDGRPIPEPYAVHFAVPAAKWWANIIYT